MSIRTPTSAAEPVTSQVFALAQYQAFDRCPICLDPNPTSREHLPPDSMGGSVMTLTCETCNNEFGSKFENHLLNWWDDAMQARFAGDGVPGNRRTPRILVRETEEGAPVIMFDQGTVDPGIRTMLTGDSFTAEWTAPDMARVRVAALKNAYLAACLITHQIPESWRATAVRSELLAARDAPRNARVALSDETRALHLGRSHSGAEPGEIALILTPHPDGTTEFSVSLARTLSVTWPLEPLQVSRESDGEPPDGAVHIATIPTSGAESPDS